MISDLSDNLPNFLIANNLPMCKERSNLFKRDYSNFDKESFQLSFESVNWKHMLENKSIDMFNSFFTTTNDINGKSIHSPKKGIKEKIKFKIKPWMTPGLRTSIRNKNKLYKQYLRNRNDHIYGKYKKYRNKLSLLLKSSKEKY